MIKITDKKLLYITGIIALIMLFLACFTFVKYRLKPKKSLTKITRIELPVSEPKTHFKKSDAKKAPLILQIEDDMPLIDFDSEAIIDYKGEVGILNVDSYNAALYSLCDQYFQVYYDDLRLSCLYPLAVANVETPGRADHSKTWSALFPSKYVDMSLLTDFDVTYIATDPARYNDLMHEHSTRDRGALQMSPTYGTKLTEFTDRMTGTESEKLEVVEIDPQAKVWAQGASTSPGDRFSTQDVILRLASATTQAITDCKNQGYIPQNDLQLVAMMAMYHHRSGIWSKAGVNGVGGWRSGAKALEYSNLLTNTSLVNNLFSYYQEHPDTFTLSSSAAKELCPEYSQYTSSYAEAVYPVKVLYSYLVLRSLYS